MAKKRVTIEKVKEFVVFLDTNKMRTNEKEITLLPHKARDWWAALSLKSDIKLMIPEVAYKELLQQKTSHNWNEYSLARACRQLYLSN